MDHAFSNESVGDISYSNHNNQEDGKLGIIDK
jgi:hypothetical protein